ncbi:hypothetical protein B0T18DRAFT_189964 [Schizothecium vesticola]|uniref:Uncharacterized protein n=1 Tax=Schizothecium vesticola TaxID=314040 RepID=A0AA40EQP4_9PEZI|nr:hypothetical protein B0T18DRAFT_189964 [Schizothecium vesticola]
MTAHPSCQHHPVPEVQRPGGSVSAPYMHAFCLSRHSPMVLQSPCAPSSPAYLLLTQPPPASIDITTTTTPKVKGRLMFTQTLHARHNPTPTARCYARGSIEMESTVRQTSTQPGTPPLWFRAKTQARPSQDYHLDLPPQVWDATPPPPTARQRARPSDRSHFFFFPLSTATAEGTRTYSPCPCQPHTDTYAAQWHGSVPLSQPQPKPGTVDVDT